MRYTLTITADDLTAARGLTFEKPELEGACFLLCKVSQTAQELRFLCREVLPVKVEAYLVREALFLSLDSPCYVSAAKRARNNGLSLLFVHSHPGGYLGFSEQDDREDPKLQQFFSARVPNRQHGSLVLTEQGVIGRVWQGDRFVPMDVARVVGDQFAFHFNQTSKSALPDFFDRQVRAFGQDLQRVLSRLTVGVVGAGGTGSAVIEQLARLGVGELVIFDHDRLEGSNVNRVYGSSSSDAGMLKVEIAARNVDNIGVGTGVRIQAEDVTDEGVILQLRDCDVVFGCTDAESPRATLTKFSLSYLMPVIDMGVVINSRNGRIENVAGRVTTLYPGEACLFCRGAIDPNRILQETRSPEEQARRVEEGYAPELAINNPAVISFTTAVAAVAINEFLHRLSGFMGAERKSTEVLCFFDKCQLKTNRLEANPDCFCMDRTLWGSGDSQHVQGQD